MTNDEGAYTSTHPGTTTVINATTGTVIDTLAVGGCAVAVSDNGDQVYVVRDTFDTTFTSKLSTSRPAESPPSRSMGHRMHWL